ncbi:MAG: biotin/lipoyl-binding protein [Hyphomicrobiales bacterium]|nr:MAG: biotin/lipoyl-binding protein [Hyphomicrobiales bacterium]
MRTSELLLRQVRHALAAAFLLGGFAALLQFAVPLFVLHAIDSAIPARSLETIALLTLLAGAAVATQTCLNAVRARILLRAGLWIEHTLGSELLRTAASSDTKSEDLSALGKLRRSASDGALLAGLDAPWQVLMIGGIALIDWRLAGVALIAAMAILAHGRRVIPDVDREEAATALAEERSAAFARALSRKAQGPDADAEKLSERWDQINRDYVGHAYILASTAVAAADYARLVRAAAQVTLLALGAWFVVDGSLTIGALAAAALLLWGVLEPVEKLVNALPSLAPARSAWLRLASLKGPAADPAAVSTSGLPHLRIAGPLAAGIAAVLAFFAVGTAVAATTRLGQIVAVTGRTLFETQLTSVFASRKGTGGQLFVKEGTVVAKGDLLATLDSRTLDARIATLKLQAATANIELASLKQDLANMTAPSAPPIRNRAPLDKLEARIAEVGRQGRDLIVQIAAAEEELARGRIVAPASGRVVSLDFRPGMPVEPDAPLFTLVTADATLLHRLMAPLGISPWPERIAGLLGGVGGYAQASD